MIYVPTYAVSGVDLNKTNVGFPCAIQPKESEFTMRIFSMLKKRKK